MSGPGRADLHIHTSYSDGAFSPAEVIRLAREAELSAIAITDHDTMEGLSDLPENPGIRVIPGIERKADWRGTEIHILGYNADWEALRRFPRVERERLERNRKMVELLRSDGVDITMEELYATKKGVVGRPHLGALLVQKGYFPDVHTAFNEWLSEGKPYFVPIEWQTVPEIAGELLSSGARVVLAHPLQYKLSDEDLRALVRLCADSGFIGMETVYSGYTAEETAYLLALAEEFGLLPSGGSDFHGPLRPERVIGRAAIPYEWVEKLLGEEQA